MTIYIYQLYNVLIDVLSQEHKLMLMAQPFSYCIDNYTNP